MTDNIKFFAALVLILFAFGVVGEMDYQDELRYQEVQNGF